MTGVPTAASRGEVVIGLDESDSARAALRAGLRSAARRGDRVRVVCAYQPPDWLGVWGYGPGVTVPLTDPEAVRRRVERWARATVARAVADLRAERGDDGVPGITVEARAARPARALVEAAVDADELVVGHRGRGSVVSGVLGSTGLACVLRAPCPVTVVPAPSSRDRR